ncbi:conserved Plasmodium protein, unknown function [Plasmodium vinckei lentum]|uniref:Metallo-beta-lactamase domain-containing protein n=1 Tax=Plasmodium vinckei lentum TaxID=138297 RepID=A0A6V7T3P4_PLAVN|nr:conserved Plasmodium protein, unknown function [Plasmodium vinckei lentum]
MITGNGIIFLGTGSSSSTPKLSHIFQNCKTLPEKNRNGFANSELRKEDFEEVEKFVDDLASKDLENIDKLNNLYLKKKYPDYSNLKCYSCYDALAENSKNRRNNISVLLKSNNSYVLIDVGKTFRESILSNNDKINFSEINLEAVLISHSHTDAMNGIDDLRDLQEYERVSYGDVYYYKSKKPIDVYLNSVSYDRLRNGFEYLAKERTENRFYSKVAALNFLILKDIRYNNLIHEDKHLDEIKDEVCCLSNQSNNTNSTNHTIVNDTNDMNNKKWINIHTCDKKDEYGFIYTTFENDKKIRFIPFQHGKNYVCVGYIVGNNHKLVYISDCNYVSTYVIDYIKKFAPIDILVIDALYYKSKHYSHFSMYESIQFSLLIKPKQVYFIGMSCDVEHNITNLYLQKLSKKYPDISFSLAHDGLFAPCDF